MEEPQQEEKRRALLEGIAAEAEEESAKIKRESERQAEEIVRGAREKAQKIREEAEERGQAQAEAHRSAARREVETAERKAFQQAREGLYREAMQRLRERMEALSREANYRDVLRGWVVEGVLALEGGSLTLRGDAQARKQMDASFFREVEREVQEYGALQVSLSLSDAAELPEPGVVISSDDGRTIFSNRLSDRIARYGSRLRRMIYSEIENGEGNEE